MSDTMNIDGVQLLPRSCCPVIAKSIYNNGDINRPLYDWDAFTPCSSFSGTDDKREILESLQDELIRLRTFLTTNPQICPDYLWMMFGDRPDDVDHFAYMYPSNIIVVPPFKLPMNFYTFIRTPGCFNHLFFHINDFWMRRLGSSLMGPATVTMYPRSGWVFLRSKYELGERYDEFVEQMEAFRTRLATLPQFVLENVSNRECPMIAIQEVRHQKRYGPRFEYQFPSVRAVLAMLEFFDRLSATYSYNAATCVNEVIKSTDLPEDQRDTLIDKVRFIGGLYRKPNLGNNRTFSVTHRKFLYFYKAIPLKLNRSVIKKAIPEASECFHILKTHPDYTLISASGQEIRVQRELLKQTCAFFKVLGANGVGTQSSERYQTNFSTRGLQFFIRGLVGLPFDKQLNELYLLEMYQMYSFFACTDLRLGHTLNWLLISQYLSKLAEPNCFISAILELPFIPEANEVITDLKLISHLVELVPQ